jgi:predicted ATPase
LLLRAARLERPQRAEGYPWSVPSVLGLQRLEFSSAVTFFVGENGCGKSTLLEALAVAAEGVALGAADLDNDPTLAAARALAAHVTLSWGTPRPVTRLFVRAEDVFGFVKRVAGEMQGLGDLESEFLSDEPPLPGSGRARAAGYMAGQRRALAQRYGADPDARSHGETFLAFLQQRIVPRGLYFFDEPETPLSPTRVLALIALLRDAAAAGSQFVIATHSPILMATPGADIRLVEESAIRSVAFDEVEHVRVTRDFLNAPERYLRQL